ncbi:MAG: hypothetical protein K9J13_00155 [Saprospiraceae bacterium]|nr:hypothetical protein [Saprospiraceae bacterium]
MKNLDFKYCMDLLMNKQESELDRLAAAESLMYCNSIEAKQTLYTIIIDNSEGDDLREEAAGSLGSLWAESEIEYEKLIQIPSLFLPELVADFKLYGVVLNKEKLGDRIDEFKQLMKIEN